MVRLAGKLGANAPSPSSISPAEPETNLSRIMKQSPMRVSSVASGPLVRADRLYVVTTRGDKPVDRPQ